METLKEFIESSEGKRLSELIGNSSRKGQRWAYLAGFCRGIVQTWHFSKNGATQEDYDKMLKTDKKQISCYFFRLPSPRRPHTKGLDL